MKRFNLFNMIHKGLRAMLYECALTLQQTYFPDEEEAAEAIQKIREAVFLFEKHGNHEDHIVMPPIKHVAAIMVEAFESEHIQDHALGSKLLHLINIFKDAKRDEERIIAGSALTKAFNDFMIFNFEHMAKEEIEINPVLWEQYSDEELMGINAQIIASISEEEKEISARWMLKGINKQEVKEWMMAVKNTSPDPVFQKLYQMSGFYLPERYRKEVMQFVVKSDPKYNGIPLSGIFAE